MTRKNNRNTGNTGYKRQSRESSKDFSSASPRRRSTGSRSASKPHTESTNYDKKAVKGRRHSKPYNKQTEGDFTYDNRPRKTYTGDSKPLNERFGAYNQDDKPAYYKKRRAEFGEGSSSGFQRKSDNLDTPRGKRPTRTFQKDSTRHNFGKTPYKNRLDKESESLNRRPSEGEKSRLNHRFDSKKSVSDPKSYLKKSFGFSENNPNSTHEDRAETQYKSPYASKGKTPNDDSKPSLFKRFNDNKITRDGVDRGKYYKPLGRGNKSHTGNTSRFHADGADTDYEQSSFAEQRKTRKSASGSKKNAPSFSKDLRLNKYIAHAGICSRREADELIANGMISVNGKTITEMGYKVKQGDVVKYGSKILSPEKMVYVLLNKPKDFLTTTEDPEERRTVMELVKNACQERIYPVGRLDRNTTGLLLFTNDGELAERLTHPSYKCKKVYAAELDKPFAEEDGLEMLQGIRMEEGLAKIDSIATLSPDKCSVGIELHIGWNRIVRRLFEAKGYKVEKLDRVMYAGLTKKDLPRGHWRHLTEKEIIALKHF